MPKDKILHIIPNFGTGGADRLAVNLLEALDRERFEAAACSLYSRSDTAFEQELKSVKSHFTLSMGNWWSIIKWLLSQRGGITQWKQS